MAGDLDPAHPERAPEAERWDSQSLQDFANTQSLDSGAALLAQSDYRGNFNAQFDQVSLLFVLQQAVVDAVVARIRASRRCGSPRATAPFPRRWRVISERQFALDSPVDQGRASSLGCPGAHWRDGARSRSGGCRTGGVGGAAPRPCASDLLDPPLPAGGCHDDR